VLGGSNLLIFRSPDGGRTWEENSAALGRGHDHGVLTVDRTNGPRRGSLYAISSRSRRVPNGIHFAVFTARSEDGGRSFADTVTHVFMNANFNVDRGLVLSDGSLVVTFTDGMRNVDGFQSRGRLERARTWLAQSLDGGRTFGTLLLASEMCGRGGGFPTAASDQSEGASRDRIYIACASRTRSEILVAKSLAGLEVWSDALRADAASKDSVSRRTAGIVVNSKGVVGTSWFEQVIGASADCQRLMFAASLDGGETFTKATPVSSQHFCVQTAANGGAARRWPAGGEYIGFAAASDGGFHFVWPDARSGIYRLRYTSVAVSIDR